MGWPQGCVCVCVPAPHRPTLLPHSSLSLKEGAETMLFFKVSNSFHSEYRKYANFDLQLPLVLGLPPTIWCLSVHNHQHSQPIGTPTMARPRNCGFFFENQGLYLALRFNLSGHPERLQEECSGAHLSIKIKSRLISPPIHMRKLASLFFFLQWGIEEMHLSASLSNCLIHLKTPLRLVKAKRQE